MSADSEAASSDTVPSEESHPEVGPAAERFHAVVTRLRRECPWDREQTHASLAPYALEEAQELAAALTATTAQPEERQIADLVEELGDVLLQVYLNAAIGEQSGTFTLADVYLEAEQKMIRRHPHVFERSPEEPEPTEAQLAKQWERIKAQERAAKAGGAKSGAAET